jgi:hypothetical protein
MSARNPEARFHHTSPSPERFTRWQEIDTTINKLSESRFGASIDRGINDLVVGLNAVLGGYFTQMSCEGHTDKSISPWVTFSLASNDLEAERKRLDGLTRLLDDFYKGRDVEDPLRLGIYPISDAGQGAYELTTGIGHKFFADDADHEYISQRAAGLLGAQQREVAELAVFVHARFLSGFVIDSPAGT